MIRVTRKRSPQGFAALVHGPGRRYLMSIPSGGKAVWKGHDYWNRMRNELYDAYEHVCAYLSFPLNPRAYEVEHYRPKEKYPQLAYEWRNYRLASSGINRRKGVRAVVDPFCVKPDSFRLNLADGSIRVSGRYAIQYTALCQDTIDFLGLDDWDIRNARLDALDEYLERHMDSTQLRTKYPFLFSELKRRRAVGRRQLRVLRQVNWTQHLLDVL